MRKILCRGVLTPTGISIRGVYTPLPKEILILNSSLVIFIIFLISNLFIVLIDQANNSFNVGGKFSGAIGVEWLRMPRKCPISSVQQPVFIYS